MFQAVWMLLYMPMNCKNVKWEKALQFVLTCGLACVLHAQKAGI